MAPSPSAVPVTEMVSQLRACGAYLPQRVVTNHELAERVDTSDTWIRERTGIIQRHIAAEGEYTSDLATHAARAALEKAGLSVDQVGLIIVATGTPDDTVPSTATRVQQKLAATHAVAFDIAAACSGFVYGLHLADALLRTGTAEHALVIGAETYSRIVDWTDRGTCVLFGDGAGAVVLSRISVAAGEANPRGLLASHIRSDGALYDILGTTGGISRTQTAGVLTMKGQEVFRHAVAKMAEISEEVLTKAGLPASAVDWVVPHQANQRILDATAQKLGISAEKLVMTMDRHANTSAASIPLALSVAESGGRLKPGNIVLMPALGAGLTWGACIIRW